MSFILKISNGNTEVDMLSVNYSLVEGGLRLPSPRYNKVSHAPLIGVHGNKYNQIEFQNRMIDVQIDVHGSDYQTIMTNVNTLSKLINEANSGGNVDLVIQVQDSDISYLKILSGSLSLPDQMFSLEGVHWYDGEVYSLNNIKMKLETAPFFTDYASYEKEGDVARVVDTTIDNGDTVSITDIAGDITTETILEFIGAYSNGIQKIYIGTGTHSLETTLTNDIDSTQTTIEVDEDYTGRLLVPFYIDIDGEETGAEVTSIDGSTWTIVRGSGNVAQSAGDPVVIQTLYDLDLDDGLSYCNTSNMRTGVVDSMSINTNGTDYVVNQIITLTGDGDGNCKARILSVTDTGAISTWEITDGGSGYTGSDTNVSIDDGTATFDIDEVTSVSESVISSTSDDLGSNYMDIDVSGQGIHDLVEWTLDRHYVATINQRVRFVGKEAQSANGWNTSLNYRIKVGYRTDNDNSFIELDKTDWKTPNINTNALFDFGSVMIPPSGSVESAPDLTIILQVQIKPDDVYDSNLDIIVYNLNIDFIKMIPVGNGFRYINCGVMPFFINDKLVDDSRKIAPYVQEYSSSFLGEVSVDGIMPPTRLVPTNSGNSLHFLFEDGGGTASMNMTMDVEVGIIGNYLGLVD